MQPIGDYLKKLLYQYDCIVVPTLGAFLTHAVSASFNEATGQFLPPRRKVAFNGALVLDDGILLNYVMLHESIPRDEALRAINSFVSTLKQEARQMGSFSVEGLGLFSYNAENSLQFEPELRHNFLGSTYGMQPVMLPNKVVHLAQPVTVVKPVPVTTGRELMPVANVPTVALAASADEEQGEVMPMPVRRSGGVWRWAAAAVLVGSLGFISYFAVVRPGEPFQSSLNPASLFQWPSFLTVEPADKVVAKPVKKPLPVEVAVVKPVEQPALPVVTPTPVVTGLKTPEAPVAGAVAPSAVAVNKLTGNRAIVPASTVSRPTKVKVDFTVIAGSFASRRNAVRFQKRLVKAGYTDAYILQGRGLIKVAAIGTNSLDEAQAGFDSLRELTGITPFIMRHK